MVIAQNVLTSSQSVSHVEVPQLVILALILTLSTMMAHAKLVALDVALVILQVHVAHVQIVIAHPAILKVV